MRPVVRKRLDTLRRRTNDRNHVCIDRCKHGRLAGSPPPQAPPGRVASAVEATPGADEAGEHDEE